MTQRRVGLFVLAAAFAGLVILAPDVLLVIFAGVLFAVFFNGGGAWIAARTGVPEAAGIGLFVLLIVVVFVGAILAFAPSVAEQVDQLIEDVPAAVQGLREWLESYAWGERLLEDANPDGLMSSASGRAAASALGSTFGALGNFVIMLFIGLYGALDPGCYRRGLCALVAPSMRPRCLEALDETGAALRGWLVAQFIAMAVVGVLTWLGLTLLGVPLAFILGLIAALLAFIPNIGPVLAALPGVLLAIPDGGTTVLLVLGVYVGVQTLESYVVTPLVQQEQVSLPPALIISTQLLLGVLFGVLGLAMATPLAAVGMTLVRELYVRDYLDREAGGPESRPGSAAQAQGGASP